VVNNDVGIWPSNLNADPNNVNNCLVVTSPTRIYIAHNQSSNDAVNNTSGEGAPGEGYQAGISDQGDGDRIIGNTICGAGYTPPLIPPPFLFTIDITFAANVTVKDNTTCGVPDNGQVSRALSHGHAGAHVSASTTR
jgi:hypothetical protein